MRSSSRRPRVTLPIVLVLVVVALTATIRPQAPTPSALIAAGAAHSLAIGADGSIWSWGDNSASQLGDGTTTPRVVPTWVAGATGTFTSVSAGSTHSLARRSDGVVVAWGLNLNGEVGDGSTTPRSAPAVLSSLANVTAVAAGGNHSLALRSNGTVAAWGMNDEGQIGDGSLTNRLTPVTVISLT